MSTGGEPAPRLTAWQRIARRRDALRRWWEARAAEADEGDSSRWGPVVLVGVLSAPVAVGILHLLIAFALDGDSLARWTVLAVVVGVAAALVGVLVWAWWQIRREPERVLRHVIAALAALLAAGVVLEAFAAVHLLLWREGSVDADAASPDLGAVERLYAWHLATAVPLLSIPNTIGWEEPRVFTDRVSGILLLTFKIVLLIPLVRAGFAVFRFVVRRAERALTAYRPTDRFAPAVTGLGLVRGCLATALFAGLCALTLVVLCDSGGLVGAWVAEAVPADVTVAGQRLPTAWARDVPVAIGVALAGLWVMAGFVVAAESWEREPPWRRPSATTSVVLVLNVLLGFVLFAELVVALDALILQTGIAHATPPLEDGGEVGAALAFNAWHLLNGIAGLRIPETLNWSLAHDLRDPWTGVLLLGLRSAALVAIVVVGVGLRPYLRSRRRPRDDEPEILVAAGLADLLHDASSAVQAAVRADLWERDAATGRAARAITRAEDDAERVGRLLGPAAADAAEEATALLRRLLDVDPRHLDDPETVERVGQIEAAIAAYAVDVRATLEGAAPIADRAH